MGIRIKGIFSKERELEIGYPTEVKHVAHIGWESQCNTPSWMNDFNTSSNFSTRSLSNLGDEPRDHYNVPVSTWSSQDFEQSMARLPASDNFKESPPNGLPKVPKKYKRKKTKSLL